MIRNPVRLRGSSPEPRAVEPTELTAVHQRSSRRLRGEPPEFPLPPDPRVSPAVSDAVSAVFGNGIDVLRKLIRSVVREELQKLNGNPSTVSSLAEVVREEVRQAVREQQPQAQPVEASVPMQPAVSYAERYVIRATTISRQYESTRLSMVLQQLTETLDSVGMIRCYRVMEKFCDRYRRLMNDYFEAFNTFILSYSFTRLIVTIFGVLVILLTIVIVVVPSRGNEEAAASVGLSFLSALTDTSCGLSTSCELKILNPRLFLEPYDGLWPSRGVVKFQHFSASYRPGIQEDVLKDICFEAYTGEKVAVVGRTGAGKSTLVLALLRIIQRTSGSITIDGIDIGNVPLKRLRSAVAVIPQDPSLFCGTLRENLDPQGSKSDTELWCALRKVGLEKFTKSNQGGLSLLLAEKGENLSAGQRQLVSFARALLRGTRILVLDEATSQMDQDTDRRVQTTLRESFSHCTLITVAHRIDTILDYDRVVVMEDGRVLEYGHVYDLLADQRSTFRSMALSAGIQLE
ncbi:hypothetical protein HPB51_000057 [Rhipicephalus microplus]|uniref:ABC transporter domain-containing protein n=1 Tax=Rhipicephalus microplus TaxID=6941 RepID=A0A9J6DDV0_RHIMP|nr:hypothetical protein HPB51_000057 [Rhipicephalus microplus]